MKVQLLTDYYPPFLDQFYKKHPEFYSLSYSAMLELLLKQYFADTGAAYFHLKKQGQEADVMVVNCEPLQKRWAEENGLSYSENSWEKEIAFAQIKSFRPDVFYIESVFKYFGDFIRQIKPYCKMVVSWISTPFKEGLAFNDIDLILSSTPKFVENFRKKGIPSEYMLPAFDVRVLKEIQNPQPKIYPFTFVGGLGSAHVNRRQALEFLVKHSDIKIWGYGYRINYPRRSWAYFRHLIFPENGSLLKHYEGELWGLAMYEVLQASLVTFNIHEALLEGHVGNMRMFEASGVGTLLLNDHGHNLSALFEPGKEIETYKNLDEALEKITYYKIHPEKAVEMGLKAQERTLKHYNYDVFISNLSDYIKKYLP